MLKVKELNIYPVKGLAGISLDSSRLNSHGLEWDRQWMLVDKNGLFLSQRKAPLMALFQTNITDNLLTIQFKSDLIQVSLNQYLDQKVEVEVWKQKMMAYLVDPAIDQWFSSHLGMDVKFVRYGKDTLRIKEKDYVDIYLKFADGYPVLVALNESLEDLNKHLERKIPMNRFRPNIVLSGAKAWDEFNWNSIQNQNGTISIAKACERCSVTTIDQKTAIKDKKEPLKTLISLHGSPALFGMNCYSETEFKIAVGDDFGVH